MLILWEERPHLASREMTNRWRLLCFYIQIFNRHAAKFNNNIVSLWSERLRDWKYVIPLTSYITYLYIWTNMLITYALNIIAVQLCHRLMINGSQVQNATGFRYYCCLKSSCFLLKALWHWRLIYLCWKCQLFTVKPKAFCHCGKKYSCISAVF